MKAMVRSGSLIALCCALMLAVAPSALGSRAHASAKWTARMTVPTHTPKARKPWAVKIVAKTARGHKLRGTVQYIFMSQGQEVARAGCHPGKTTPCAFKGTYKDVVRWPVKSVGIRLTFRAVVKTKLGTKNLDWWVQVRRK
jgi:hypothetical protein